MTFRERSRAAKRSILELAVMDAHGNRTLAAQRLGMQRTYLQRLARDLQADLPRPGARA